MPPDKLANAVDVGLHNEDHLDHLVKLVPPETMDSRVHPETPAKMRHLPNDPQWLRPDAKLVRHHKMANLAHRDHLDHRVVLASLEHPHKEEERDQEDHRDHLDQMANRVTKDHQGQMDHLDIFNKDHHELVHLAQWAHLANLETMEPQANRENQDILAHKDHQEVREPLVRQDNPEARDNPEKPELRETTDNATIAHPHELHLAIEKGRQQIGKRRRRIKNDNKIFWNNCELKIIRKISE